MTVSTYEKIRSYHEQKGDDYGSEESRRRKYATILSLLALEPQHTLLDVGCGERHFESLVRCSYTGIDLLEGVNVLDYDEEHDWVVANGLIYKLPDEREARRVLSACWRLARLGLVFTSLNHWEHYHVEELCLDPYDTLRWAHKTSGCTVLRMDYKPGDFAIGMYRR